MLAVLDDDLKSFIERNRRLFQYKVTTGAERLLDHLLIAEQPRRALSASSDQHAMDAGLAHAPTDITHVLHVAVT